MKVGVLPAECHHIWMVIRFLCMAVMCRLPARNRIMLAYSTAMKKKRTECVNSSMWLASKMSRQRNFRLEEIIRRIGEVWETIEFTWYTLGYIEFVVVEFSGFHLLRYRISQTDRIKKKLFTSIRINDRRHFQWDRYLQHLIRLTAFGLNSMSRTNGVET